MQAQRNPQLAHFSDAHITALWDAISDRWETLEEFKADDGSLEPDEEAIRASLEELVTDFHRESAARGLTDIEFHEPLTN